MSARVEPADAQVTPRPHLPSWVWLWTPLAVVLISVGVGAYCKTSFEPGTREWRARFDWYQLWFVGELGFIEIATAAVLLAACAMGVRAVVAGGRLEVRWVRQWLVLVLLGAIYFLGEEVSWGQHYVGWETPEWYAEKTGNRQDETNLHNISGWFNQKPRHLFLAWVVAGGIVVPLSRRLRGSPTPAPSSFWTWFWPTAVCTPCAALAVLVKVPEWIVDTAGITGQNSGYYLLTAAPNAEMQEFCLGAFLLVYCWSLDRRLREHRV